jgi:hypothetical protein
LVVGGQGGVEGVVGGQYTSWVVIVQFEELEGILASCESDVETNATGDDEDAGESDEGSGEPSVFKFSDESEEEPIERNEDEEVSGEPFQDGA